ncbi:hypothetical protein ACFE04_006347 [Oxalis oulophora]
MEAAAAIAARGGTATGGGGSLYLSLPPQPPPPQSQSQSQSQSLLLLSRRSRRLIRCCLSNNRNSNSNSSGSGGGGGGVSDDYFVSTRKSTLANRGFSVILKMLKRIEPLDNCVISKGVSHSAKDSMKQTISTMLGLLPSDQFSVSVNFSKDPLDRLLVSSIITGYTLWNADYRISLVRNFDSSTADVRHLGEVNGDKTTGDESHEFETVLGFSDLEKMQLQIFQDLPPEALNYINQLQSQLSHVKEELNVQKHKNMQVEYERGSRNDLLEYLRSLDAEMITELSRPSSEEVEEIIHQLVQNVLRKLFKEDGIYNITQDAVVKNKASQQNGDEENCGLIGTSRDYLAKLLFWCMLLGHHLRGLENRLQLSCVVGFL